jgi:hypothetical protein
LCPLVLRRKVLGPEQLDTLRSINDLASALSRQGKYVEADQTQTNGSVQKQKMFG